MTLILHRRSLITYICISTQQYNTNKCQDKEIPKCRSSVLVHDGREDGEALGRDGRRPTSSQ